MSLHLFIFFDRYCYKVALLMAGLRAAAGTSPLFLLFLSGHLAPTVENIRNNKVKQPQNTSISKLNICKEQVLYIAQSSTAAQWIHK